MKAIRVCHGFHEGGRAGGIGLTRLLFLVACGTWISSLSFGPAVAQAYRLPDTGQTKCYDDVGNEIACPAAGQRFHGQDGNYAGPQPSYGDNGDGTVTDLNTGLMWQQEDDGATRNWQSAMDYCTSLSLAGHGDWRLPSDAELMSIVSYGTSYPAIDTRYFPNCRSYYYWSSTTYADVPDGAWVVGFYGGHVGYDYKSNGYYVRCVRTGA